MKRRNKNLEWYAFIYDWNSKSLHNINVLGTSFADNILKRVKHNKINNYEELREEIRMELSYYFRSKAECEVLVTDLFPKNYDDFVERAVKLDVYHQLEPNLDRIVEYIMKELNIEFE